MADIITRSSIVAEVPKTWAQAYEDYVGPDAEGMKRVTDELFALPPGFSAEDVENIIGNDTWTMLHCDQCGDDVDYIVRLGITLTYDLCEVCLGKAGMALLAFKSGGRS